MGVFCCRVDPISSGIRVDLAIHRTAGPERIMGASGAMAGRHHGPFCDRRYPRFLSDHRLAFVRRICLALRLASLPPPLSRLVGRALRRSHFFRSGSARRGSRMARVRLPETDEFIAFLESRAGTRHLLGHLARSRFFYRLHGPVHAEHGLVHRWRSSLVLSNGIGIRFDSRQRSVLGICSSLLCKSATRPAE